MEAEDYVVDIAAERWKSRYFVRSAVMKTAIIGLSVVAFTITCRVFHDEIFE